MVPYIILSFALSIISMPIIIKLCNKYSLYDYQSSRKIHFGNISRLGGIGIAISFFVSTILYLIFSTTISFTAYFPVILAGLIIFIFGLVDDLITMRAIVKLLVQILASFIVIIYGFRFKQIASWEIPTFLSYAITFCWIIGVINAFNLIDGLDGLCGSLSFTAIITLGIIYALSGNNGSAICFILGASILGFLCFNWPPAKLFMGDCGSQFLGFMISTAAFFPANYTIEFNKFLIITCLAAFPIFDTIAAIWRRIRDKRPIMSPDEAHLHHKLLNLGYTKQNSLYLIVFIQVILCSFVVLSYILGTYKGAMVLVLTIFFISLFFTFIHYTNKAILKQNKSAQENKE